MIKISSKLMNAISTLSKQLPNLRIIKKFKKRIALGFHMDLSYCKKVWTKPFYKPFTYILNKSSHEIVLTHCFLQLSEHIQLGTLGHQEKTVMLTNHTVKIYFQ